MEEIINSRVTDLVQKITPFVDYNSFSKIINKLTDYAEILTEGKLSGIINHNFGMNSIQTNLVIELLCTMQALSRIYDIAQKGKRDLEEEYISNIYPENSNPSGSSSYISIRNSLENRLNNQVQLYNMNMNKSNTTLAIPVNELHGHVKTYRDLSINNVTISHKAQHGYIAASLHDAYLTIQNRPDWRDDRTYMKYFFNEDDPSKQDLNLLTKEPRLSLFEIGTNIQKVLNYFNEISISRFKSGSGMEDDVDDSPDQNQDKRDSRTLKFSDRLLMSPFGRQYGTKIDSIINEIFSNERLKDWENKSDEEIKSMVKSLFQVYLAFPGSLGVDANQKKTLDIVNFLLSRDYGLKKFTEKYLYHDRKIPFNRFYTENMETAENFITALFNVFFEETFSSIFRIIRSLDMKQYACAFIIKRTYIIMGEDLPIFGFFLIKAIARNGKIKVV